MLLYEAWLPSSIPVAFICGSMRLLPESPRCRNRMPGLCFEHVFAAAITTPGTHEAILQSWSKRGGNAADQSPTERFKSDSYQSRGTPERWPSHVSREDPILSVVTLSARVQGHKQARTRFLNLSFPLLPQSCCWVSNCLGQPDAIDIERAQWSCDACSSVHRAHYYLIIRCVQQQSHCG